MKRDFAMFNTAPIAVERFNAGICMADYLSTPIEKNALPTSGIQTAKATQ